MATLTLPSATTKGLLTFVRTHVISSLPFFFSDGLLLSALAVPAFAERLRLCNFSSVPSGISSGDFLRARLRMGLGASVIGPSEDGWAIFFLRLRVADGFISVGVFKTGVSVVVGGDFRGRPLPRFLGGASGAGSSADIDSGFAADDGPGSGAGANAGIVAGKGGSGAGGIGSIRGAGPVEPNISAASGGAVGYSVST